MHCILCIAFYALSSMHCIQCIVFYALYSIYFILCIVFCWTLKLVANHLTDRPGHNFLLNLDQAEQNIVWLFRLSRAVAKDQNKSAIAPVVYKSSLSDVLALCLARYRGIILNLPSSSCLEGWPHPGKGNLPIPDQAGKLSSKRNGGYTRLRGLSTWLKGRGSTVLSHVHRDSGPTL